MNFQYKEKSDKAYALHQKGQLKEAEELYLELLDIRPDDVNILNLYGLLLINTGNYEDAVNYISKAFIYRQEPYVAANLAKAYYMSGDYEKSEKMYKTALSFGENDDIYYSLAITYKKLNRLDDAINCYKKSVSINPSNTNSYYNLMLIYESVNKLDKAIETGVEACKYNTEADEIYTLLSDFYEKSGDYNSAVNCLEESVRISPKEHVYYYNLGVLYAKLGKLKEAEENFKKAIIINPEHFESYINIAVVYRNMNKNSVALEYLKTAYVYQSENPIVVCAYAQSLKDECLNDESINVLKKFLEKDTSNPEVYSLLGINYCDKGEYKKALDYYERALSLAPENPSYLHGKAIALKYSGDTDACKKILEAIVQNGNADSQTRVSLGMIYLQNKDFEKGMELYLERNFDTAFASVFEEKMLRKGVDISDKIILLYSNCGLGDTIMYSRFFNPLKEKCKSLILQTDLPLVSVMRRNFPDISVVSKTTLPGVFDYSLPVMDIQYILELGFDKIRPVDSYLSADDSLVEKFKNDIFSKSHKPKIGLCWQGSKKILKNRSVNFSIINDLVTDKRFDFYSFQLDYDVSNNENIISLKEYINDYGDTAAMLKNLDIMITIDSSIVHMAGALGVRTFLVLPHTSEWRWFFDTEKTIWYESVKIFKQKEINNFSEVFERIKIELNNYAS